MAACNFSLQIRLPADTIVGVLRASDDGERTVGSRLGRYEILKGLARGGMAEILLARARGLEGFEKYVVIKKILPQYHDDPRFIQMFIDEARLASQLHHPNIGQVYDIGQGEDGYFFAMEYLHGADARSILKAAYKAKKRLPLGSALAIVCGAGTGLHYAHERVDHHGESLNVVHRDVSPSNVLVTYDGGVKLVDFGIARATTRTVETRTGNLKGKLAYMSPEQCFGKAVDRRSDIFSLGIVMYELTTGQRLFRRRGESDYQVMDRIVHCRYEKPTAVVKNYPVELERILLRALANEPEDRYSTAAEMVAEIEKFAHQQRLSMSPASLSEFLTGLMGTRPEPWLDLADQGEDARPTKAIAPKRARGRSVPPPIPAQLSLGIPALSTRKRAPSAPPTGRRRPAGIGGQTIASKSSAATAFPPPIAKSYRQKRISESISQLSSSGSALMPALPARTTDLSSSAPALLPPRDNSSGTGWWLASAAIVVAGVAFLFVLTGEHSRSRGFTNRESDGRREVAERPLLAPASSRGAAAAKSSAATIAPATVRIDGGDNAAIEHGQSAAPTPAPSVELLRSPTHSSDQSPTTKAATRVERSRPVILSREKSQGTTRYRPMQNDREQVGKTPTQRSVTKVPKPPPTTDRGEGGEEGSRSEPAEQISRSTRERKRAKSTSARKRTSRVESSQSKGRRVAPRKTAKPAWDPDSPLLPSQSR